MSKRSQRVNDVAGLIQYLKKKKKSSHPSKKMSLCASFDQSNSGKSWQLVDFFVRQFSYSTLYLEPVNTWVLLHQTHIQYQTFTYPSMTEKLQKLLLFFFSFYNSSLLSNHESDENIFHTKPHVSWHFKCFFLMFIKAAVSSGASWSDCFSSSLRRITGSALRPVKHGHTQGHASLNANTDTGSFSHLNKRILHSLIMLTDSERKKEGTGTETASESQKRGGRSAIMSQ